MILLYFVLVLVILGYSIAIKKWADRMGSRNKSEFNLSLLPDFPNSSKLYFEESLGRECRRCKSKGDISAISIRKRFLLVKNEEGILTVRPLTNIYQCLTCGYRGLYLSDENHAE